MAIATQLLP
jgi:hypothetical protein